MKNKFIETNFHSQIENPIFKSNPNKGRHELKSKDNKNNNHNKNHEITYFFGIQNNNIIVSENPSCASTKQDLTRITKIHIVRSRVLANVGFLILTFKSIES